MESAKRSNMWIPPILQPRKKARLNENDKKLQNFLNWCQAGHLTISDKVKVSWEGSCAQYGMVAVADIEAGDVLFDIPRTCLLHPETSSICQLLKNERSSIHSESGWVPLLLALMLEYTSPASRWRPYLEIVPDFDELDLPMFWNSETISQELCGTGVPEAVHKDLDNISEEFHSVVLPFVRKHANIFPPQCQDLEVYKKLVAFVMAYSFTEPLPEGADSDDEEEAANMQTKPLPMMVPMADILNHVAKNNAHLDFGKESLKMVATEAIPKGKEVFNTYGQLANCQLLHMYGFSEPYPNNHFDTVDISSRKLLDICKKKDPGKPHLFDKKWKFLKDTGVVHEDSMFVIGEEGILTEEEAYHTLKVLVMNETQFAEHQEKEGWSDIEEEVENPESLTWSDIQKLPVSWKLVLKAGAEDCLRTYYNSAVDDEAKLTQERFFSLTQRQKFSLHVRHGQRKLLEKLGQFCSDSSENGS